MTQVCWSVSDAVTANIRWRITGVNSFFFCLIKSSLQLQLVSVKIPPQQSGFNVGACAWCGLVCSLWMVTWGSSMLLISTPGPLSGSMGLKDAVSSGMEAYKCWSLWSLPPAACWRGHEEQFAHRQEEALLADKRYPRWGAAREEVRLCVDGGWGWFVSLWCNFDDLQKVFVLSCCFYIRCSCDFSKMLCLLLLKI